MEIITIEIRARVIEVMDGKISGSRLGYQAPGLDIYLYGAIPNNRRHAVHYHACLEAAARHIPLMSLRDVSRKAPKPEPVNPKQKEMFK